MILHEIVRVSPGLIFCGFGSSASLGASVTFPSTVTDTVLDTEPPSFVAVTVYLPESSAVA